ncbi:MAG: enoyl-CoA hydratase/isomerase family protein [Clostridia bacterium]|nr:enoyl-CoA hydratase/isomerase family protein [Clostridia bacterium]
MAEEKVRLERHEAVAEVVLNRPDKYNAIDTGVLEGLDAVLDQIEADDGLRAVLIRGEGRVFCAGADLEHVEGLRGNALHLERFLRYWHRVFNRLDDFPKPTVAVVQGLALAGGLELVLACDLAVAAADARLGDQHGTYGLIPGGGGSQRLPRVIGPRRAKELIFLGSWLSAEEAERIGLVNRVVPAAELLQAGRDLAGQLAARSPLALREGKFLVNRGLAVDLATGLELELQAAVRHLQSEDVRIGLEAFKERKTPRFVGR